MQLNQSLVSGFAVLAIAALWGITLYLAQEWGYQRGQDSRKDALKRRIQAEHDLLLPVTVGNIEIPLSAAEDEFLNQTRTWVTSRITESTEDISRYCTP